MTSNRCILPWIHQHGDISGSYALCCFTLNKAIDLIFFSLKDLSMLLMMITMKKARLAYAL